jgi:S1-C subfamily serine protease
MFLSVLDGPLSGRTVRLDRSVTVGRDADCGISLDHDERVSRRHAGFAPQPDGTVIVTDLGSTNGVFVDGKRITGPVTVRSGDSVRIGRTTVTVRATDPALGPATVVGGASDPLTGPPAAPPAPAHASDAGGAAASSRPKRTLLIAGVVAAAVAVVAVVGVVVVVGGGDDEGDRELTAAEITEQSAAGVLQVQAEIDGQLIGTGTGWVYDIDQGLIVTNHHVVGAGNEFSVGVGPNRCTATLVGAAPCEDLAVLRVDRTDDLVELPLGSQSEVANGEESVALGYPGTASQTPSLITSTGSISSPRSSFDAPAIDLPRYPNVVITQTPINPGNSGGPLLNMRGEVIGVNSAGSAVNQNQNYAVGVDRVKEIVPKLANGDSLGWTGLVLTFPSSPEEVEALGWDPLLFGQAIFAVDAVPQSPAANTGLFRTIVGGAVPIIGIDDNAMDGTLQTYCKAVGDLERGDDTTFNLTDGVDIFDFDLSFA